MASVPMMPVPTIGEVESAIEISAEKPTEMQAFLPQVKRVLLAADREPGALEHQDPFDVFTAGFVLGLIVAGWRNQ